MRISPSWVLFASALIGALSGSILTSILTSEPLFFHEARAIIRVLPASALPALPAYAQPHGLGRNLPPGDPHLSFIASKNIFEELCAKLGLPAKWDIPLKDCVSLVRNSTVYQETSGNDKTFWIIVRLGRSRDSKEIANALADAYLRSRFDHRQKEAGQRLSEVNKTIYAVSESLLWSERILARFERSRLENRVVDGKETLLQLNARSDIDSLKDLIRTELTRLDELEFIRLTLTGRVPDVPATLLNKPLVEPTRAIPNVPAKSLWGALAGMLLLPGLASLGLCRSAMRI